MRVLHIFARLNVGGIAGCLGKFSLLLQKSGHEVRILTGIVDENVIPVGVTSGYDIRYLPSPRKTSIFFQDLYFFWVIKNEIKFFNPTIVNIHTPKARLLMRLANITLLHQRPKLIHTLQRHLKHEYFPKWQICLIVSFVRFLESHRYSPLKVGK